MSREIKGKAENQRGEAERSEREAERSERGGREIREGRQRDQRGEAERSERRSRERQRKEAENLPQVIDKGITQTGNYLKITIYSRFVQTRAKYIVGNSLHKISY